MDRYDNFIPEELRGQREKGVSSSSSDNGRDDVFYGKWKKPSICRGFLIEQSIFGNSEILPCNIEVATYTISFLVKKRVQMLNKTILGWILIKRVVNGGAIENDGEWSGDGIWAWFAYLALVHLYGTEMGE